MTWASYLHAKRRECWGLGIQHREALLSEYMARTGMCERPFLKDVVDDLLTAIQGVHLLEVVLPLDTFAQSEVVRDRIEVSINTRIPQMPGVKDVDGIAHVAKWHESIHVERDLGRSKAPNGSEQFALPGLDVDAPRLIVCRRTGANNHPNAQDIEFVAENAAVAAAIAVADLTRSPAFLEYQQVAGHGGDVTIPGWSLLAEAAAQIGVNRAALVKYLMQQGRVAIVQEGGKRRLIATKRLPAWDEDEPNP